MKLHRIAAVVERHAYEARRNLERVTDAVYWPVIDIIVWGFFSLYLLQRNGLRPPPIGVLLGAAVFWGMFRAFQRDIAMGFLTDMWSHNLVGLFSSPLTVVEYIAGLLIIDLLKAITGTCLAGLVALVLYGYNVFGLLPAFLPFAAVLVLFGLAVGILVAGLIFRYTTRIQSFAWSVTGLVMPVSCVFYPLSALPRPMRLVALSFPTTYAFEGMRQIIAGGKLSVAHLAAAVALDAAYLGIAIVLFVRLFRAARARGLLVKLE
jgi:ABC-2 type transport system permease protein